MKVFLVRGITLLVSLFLLLIQHAVAEDEQYGLMPLSVFDNEKEFPIYKPQHDLKVLRSENYPKTFSLFEYLGTKGSERHQGSCGSCWVWAFTGMLEVMFNKSLHDGQFAGVDYVQNQKFSINLNEAKQKELNNLTGTDDTICDGGNVSQILELHDSEYGFDFIIPKANFNADNNAITQAERDKSTLDSIQIDPSVTVSLEAKIIQENEYEAFTQDIITALNAGYPIWYAMKIYSGFSSYWYDKSEDDLYHFPNKNEERVTSAHAVLLVGYDMSSSNSDEHCWILVNSWGTRSNRPNGIFKIPFKEAFSGNMEAVIIEPNFKITSERCDNLDNDCNTVVNDNIKDFSEVACDAGAGECVNKGAGVYACFEAGYECVGLGLEPQVEVCDGLDNDCDGQTDEDFIDSDDDGIPDCMDECPDNPNKQKTGVCGCNNSDKDTDKDGTPDCVDLCPKYKYKIEPGICGCEARDVDVDGDGIVDCLDGCTRDANKTAPGACGCGILDIADSVADSDSNGIINCQEENFGKFKQIVLGVNRASSAGTNYKTIQCLLTEFGYLYCRGTNTYGEVGAGTTDDFVDMPTFVLKDVIKASAGYNHACAIIQDKLENSNKLYCWGSNEYGALGLLDTSIATISAPHIVEVNLGGEPIDVACGKDATCVLNDKHEVYCFGDNYANKLGVEGPFAESKKSLNIRGTATFNGKSTKINLANITKIKMSALQTAVISDGKLYVFGQFYNQPFEITRRYSDFENIKDVALSDARLCILTDAGEVYCYDIESAEEGTPQKIDLTNISSIETSSSFSHKYIGTKKRIKYYTYTCNDLQSSVCALSADDKLYCWGKYNKYSQLGYEITDSVQPNLITNTDVFTVGSALNCYLTKDRETWLCRGDVSSYIKDTDRNYVLSSSQIGSKANQNIIKEGENCSVEAVKKITGTYEQIGNRFICKADFPITDTDGDKTYDFFDYCPNNENKVTAGVCGCDYQDIDSDSDGVLDCVDGCPYDKDKINAGECGCGVADNDTDKDGTLDCQDGCPNDPNKVIAGACGCGIADIDTDKDGTLDCQDGCPNDPNKVVTGACGCGVADTVKNGKIQCGDEICPKNYPLGLTASKKGPKKISLVMEKIDPKCFAGKIWYKILIKNRAKKFSQQYKINKNKFIIKGLKKGKYSISYRVINIKQKVKYRSHWAKAVKVKL